jgi:6-pyruvoyl-tetrahydropterin synthase
MRIELSHEVTFTSEHQPVGHEAHTHPFRLVVTLAGEMGADGMLVPFADVQAAVSLLLRTIECVPPLVALPGGSSVEQMAVWIWRQLVDKIPELVAVHLTDGTFTATHRGVW